MTEDWPHTPNSDLADSIARLAAGYEGTYALISHLADQLVDHWHDFPIDRTELGSLAEFMGFTDEQYKMFAEGRYGDLVDTFIGQD